MHAGIMAFTTASSVISLNEKPEFASVPNNLDYLPQRVVISAWLSFDSLSRTLEITRLQNIW